MSKAIDTEIPALRTRIRNLEKALDAQTKLVMEMTEKTAEAVAELRSMRHSAMTDVANWLAQKLGGK